MLKLDYDLEWRDADGQVLQKVPMTIPLGGRAPMGDGPVRLPHEGRVAPEGAFVTRVEGPADATSVASVRLVKRGAGGGLLALAAGPGGEVPAPLAAPDQTLVLPQIGAALAAVPGPVAVTKIRNTGSDANRLVIAILGDGFTQANLAAGTFSNKVTSFFSTFFATSPWNNYASAVNVYRVDVISNQSGADYEDAAPGAGGTQKDTYLNAGFWVGGIERCLFLNGNGVARAMAAADAYVGVGVWDEILVFVNATKYGGCGGQVGVSSLNSSSDEIQIHEFGHSFADLTDEYDTGSGSTTCSSASARNVDCSNNFPHVKWDVWVTPGTPFPTPETPQYANAVGAFEGAAYQQFGMFRPKQDCRMRTLGVAFCPICKEAHILKLFRDLRLLDGVNPPLGPVDVPALGSQTFAVAPVNLGGLSFQWSLDGVSLANATNAFVNIFGNQITRSNAELRVEVTHTTPLVRAETIAQTNYWSLRTTPLPTLSIAATAVAEHNVGTTHLVFPVRLSFAPTAPVSVHYTTSNGTATAGSDYVALAGLLSFATNQTSNAIIVMVKGDLITESNEMLFVNLSSPTNATLAEGQATGVIVDDDSPPTLTIARSIPPVVLTWTPAEALLQSADFVNGPWSDVRPTPPNPYTVMPGGAAQFYRVRLPDP